MMCLFNVKYIIRSIFMTSILHVFTFLTVFSHSGDSISENIPMTSRLRNLEARSILNHNISPKDFVNDLINKGYNVLTTGAMFGTGYALIENSILPLHPKANPNWLKEIIRESHKKDIKVNCWMCFNIQDVRLHKDQFIIDSLYPSYKMEFIEGPYEDYPDQTGMCMIASPYINDYVRLVKEVAALGSDGIWFDGFYLSGLPSPSKPGCTCNYCKERFRKETGLELPQEVDWTNLTFKKWVRWRNKRLFEVAEFLTEEIHKVNPDCKVTFNTNTWPFYSKDWITAVPLWKTNKFGVSQHAYYNVTGMRWLMLGYKSKISHDMNPGHSDIWQMSRNRFNTGDKSLDSSMNRIYMFLHNYAGLTFGTAPWRARPDPEIVKQINKAVAPAEKWFQTNQIRNVGVLVSQNTHDFWGHIPGTDNLTNYRNSIIGTWLLLMENHIQFEFIFDNQLENGDVSGFKTIVLPNSACLSKKQISVLNCYVESGGKLLLTENAAQYDEWGDKKINASGLIDQSIYFETDPGIQFLKNRDVAIEKKFIAAIKDGNNNPIEVIAPPYIAFNSFRGKNDQKLYIHLLNVKSFYDDGNDFGFWGLGDQDKSKDKKYWPQENISENITIKLKDRLHISPILYPENENINIQNKREIKISQMGLYQMICIEFDRK
jgi:hypothetical protein